MKRKREQVETIDHVVYWSDDRWATVWRQLSKGVHEQVLGKEADRARFLAIAQSTSEGGRS